MEGLVTAVLTAAAVWLAASILTAAAWSGWQTRQRRHGR